MFILRILFTVFVVALVILPLPPSTFIGLAIIGHPKTNKHLDQRVIIAVAFTGTLLKESVIAAMGGHIHHHNIINNVEHEIHA